MKKTLLLVPLLGAVAAGVIFGSDVIGQAAEKKNQPAAPAAASAEAAKAQDQAKPQEQPAQQVAAVPPTVFDEHARQGRIGTCSGVFAALGRGVVADATYTAQTHWDPEAASAHSVASLVSLEGGASTPGVQGAGVVFAAPVGRSCEGTLVRVTPVKTNCQTLQAELVKAQGQAGTLGALPLVAMPNGAQVVLVPLDQSCIAMTSLRAAG
ncbi:hypothetical protein KXS07_37030 [Inquilinus limosus]|uniref:hypothetical protein n=1 Tax=Inquilinus limosus TaxID=171674 RepID=UPI003F15219F